MSGIGRPHLGARCAGKYDGGGAVLLFHHLVALHTAPSGAFCTRTPDVHATIIQLQCLEAVLDSSTMATTNLHRLHPAIVSSSCNRPLGLLGQLKFYLNSSSVAKATR